MDGTLVTVLSPEDTLLYLADRLSKEAGQLKLLCDIAETLKKYMNTLDWEYIVRSAESWQTKTAVYYSLTRAKDLLGAPVPSSELRILQPNVLRRGVLDLLASRGVFTSPIQSEKLREETAALVHSLMMKRIHQSLTALTRYRGIAKRLGLLRTSVWTVPVFACAVARYVRNTILTTSLRKENRPFVVGHSMDDTRSQTNQDPPVPNRTRGG